MEKRRDFIRKSVMGLTAGLAAGGLGISRKSYASPQTEDVKLLKNW